MAFAVATRGKKTGQGTGVDENFTSSSRMSMYLVPPSGEIALEEFEEFAIDRLRVLRGIDEEKSRGKKPEELKDFVYHTWRKHMESGSKKDDLRKDVISHFVLRLAYCRTEDLRKWVLTQEATLFKNRFINQEPRSQEEFMRDSQLPFESIGGAEYADLKTKLDSAALSAHGPKHSVATVYYKVPFEEVPDLVSSRKVFLKKGFAYVPRDELAAIVVGHFRTNLSRALVLTHRHWASKVAHEERDRLAPIVEVLSSRHLGADFSRAAVRGDLSAASLDSLAAASFPLCMRHLFLAVREEHHLKHGGRMQLGLFIKGIGLSLDEALAFWRSEFSQKMGVEKFEKEYAYAVRHNYGREGKRTDYSPMSCIKLITSTPGAADRHGCPFKHFNEENLRSAMGSLHLSPRTVEEALGKVKGHHYQLACGAVFDGVHNVVSEIGINHPNQYFEESRKILNPGAAQADPATTTPQGVERIAMKEEGS